MNPKIALLLALLPLGVVADVVVPAEKVKNSVNIRQEPDATSDVVGRLQKGSSLPLVSSADGWNEVRLDADTTGFVSADWSEIEEEPEAAAAEEAQEPVEAAEEVEVAVDVEIAEDVEIETAAVERKEAEIRLERVSDPIAAADPAVMAGPPGPQGPPGPAGAANIKGKENFLVRFKKETEGGSSQVYDNGSQVGIGTTEPKQRLEVNGSIQIHEQNSSVAGLMITQSSGDTGYIMHNLASTLTIGAGSQDRITIDREGNVGIGVAKPEHPLEMASGAHATAGGVWTNASSRDLKENIADLSAERAEAALMRMQPVSFNYRGEPAEDYVGFIAEDVPELVASSDRQSLSAMDIVAVLTKVVQQQQRRIADLEARLDANRRK